MQGNLKEEKQKVTLYLPQELHRDLKIKAAVDSETMTDIAQKAIVFYLNHSDVVEQVEAFGQAHRLYSCPECSTSVVVRNGELVALRGQVPMLVDDGLAVDESRAIEASSEGESELVPC
jgi:hypothetical protein